MDKCSFSNCNKSVFVKKTDKGPLCNGHYAQYRKGHTLTPLRNYGERQLSKDHGKCPIDGCGRPSWHKEGLCQSHKKQIKNSDVLEPIRTYQFQHGSQCQVDGCHKPAKSKKYCASHYRQDWGQCKSAGCVHTMYNKRTGYCSIHYAEFKRS